MFFFLTFLAEPFTHQQISIFEGLHKDFKFRSFLGGPLNTRVLQKTFLQCRFSLDSLMAGLREGRVKSTM